mmetsp:Transcript_32839/g.81751  ORF Transcript_32839/g.81751 Transcript_32839/m.81751 type:complete len:204 (-) Transcript_32839:180-791(-)
MLTSTRRILTSPSSTTRCSRKRAALPTPKRQQRPSSRLSNRPQAGAPSRVGCRQTVPSGGSLFRGMRRMWPPLRSFGAISRHLRSHARPRWRRRVRSSAAGTRWLRRPPIRMQRARRWRWRTLRLSMRCCARRAGGCWRPRTILWTAAGRTCARWRSWRSWTRPSPFAPSCGRRRRSSSVCDTAPRTTWTTQLASRCGPRCCS